MKQWIRWSGLAAFIIIVALLAAFFVLAAGPLVKMAIERFGSEMAGAKVNVEDVSLSFNPLGFHLQQLTVADADQPMQNLLECSQATADVELVPLLLGKGIVRNLSVDGLQFGTARTESGALEKTTKAEEKAATAEDSAGTGIGSLVELPSADEILARESLQTEAAGVAFQGSYKTHEAAVSDAVKGVPDSAALKKYEDELKAITSGSFTSLDDFKARKKALDELKARFKQDKAAINAAQQVVANAKSDLSEKLTALKNAPGQDMTNIRSKYQLSGEGAANVSALLFGSEAGEWAQQALHWYEMISPYLSSSADGDSKTADEAERIRDGRFVHFPSSNPWPEFLLREAHITALVPAGKLLIRAENITHQQAVLGKPAHIVVNGSELPQIEDLTADIVLDHRKSPANDSLTMTAKNWQLKGMNLGVGGTELESAMLQVQGLAVVSAGQLNAKTDMQFGQTAFSGAGKTTFAKELTRALGSIKRFDINARASGSITSPQVELGSDLDKQLTAAFSQRLDEKQNELEAKLKAGLQQKLQGYVGDYGDQLAQLNQLDGSLSDKMNSITKLTSAKMEDYEAQKKREAADKAAEKKSELKDKAKDKLKSLF